MAGIATHYIPSTRLPALLARLAELESDDFEVVNYAIEEFVGDAISIEKWKNWTLGGEIRKSIDRCFSKNSITEIFKALEKEVKKLISFLLITLFLRIQNGHLKRYRK